ncbi:cytochrome b5 reductase 4-like isoform X1 [Asterias amurensis]|uniref:cytochrome b5 reductase 4-like isoform X1 n=2 Tax=Asterias amurensis TaxID=7602 RepID=UPI003AB5ACE8
MLSGTKMQGLQVPKPQFPSLNSPQRASATNGTKQSRKVALTPGHSLMDWVRLGKKEGRNLNGKGGQIQNVSVEELARHNKVDDAWMSIRGKVYNVTPYMKFHPGGEDEMMRGAGADGTSLFDDVHQWVNVESMLEKCYVGQLRKSIEIKDRLKDNKKEINHPKDTAPVNSDFKTPSNSKSEAAIVEKPKARYDWYQNGGQITVTIYTKCNFVKADHLVIDKKQRELQVTLNIDEYVYTLHVGLFADITDTYNGIRVLNGPVHRVIFILNKKDVDLKWVTFGSPLEGNNTVVHKTDRDPVFRSCEVLSCQPLTHDIKLLALQLPQGSHMIIPIGYHVYLRVNHNGEELSRPYTVVSSTLLPQDYKAKEICGRIIYLMIKMYPNGHLTQQLAGYKEGDMIDVSDYEGSFVESRLDQADTLVLVAAGTGFTPMVKLLQWNRIHNKQQTKHIKLIFFNKTERDIPWREDLSELLKTQPKSFEIINILSEPDERWSGPKGRIRKEIVEEYFPCPDQPQQRFLMCICGPTQFTQLAFKLSKAYGYTDEMIHVFAA